MDPKLKSNHKILIGQRQKEVFNSPVIGGRGVQKLRLNQLSVVNKNISRVNEDCLLFDLFYYRRWVYYLSTRWLAGLRGAKDTTVQTYSVHLGAVRRLPPRSA